jgi:hypothetical protein
LDGSEFASSSVKNTSSVTERGISNETLASSRNLRSAAIIQQRKTQRHSACAFVHTFSRQTTLCQYSIFLQDSEDILVIVGHGPVPQVQISDPDNIRAHRIGKISLASRLRRKGASPPPAVCIQFHSFLAEEQGRAGSAFLIGKGIPRNLTVSVLLTPSGLRRWNLLDWADK